MSQRKKNELEDVTDEPTEFLNEEEQERVVNKFVEEVRKSEMNMCLFFSIINCVLALVKIIVSIIETMSALPDVTTYLYCTNHPYGIGTKWVSNYVPLVLDLVSGGLFFYCAVPFYLAFKHGSEKIDAFPLCRSELWIAILFSALSVLTVVLGGRLFSLLWFFGMNAIFYFVLPRLVNYIVHIDDPQIEKLRNSMYKLKGA